MMNELLTNRQVAYGALAAGVVAVIASVLIDPVRGEDLYMGTAQIVVLIVGLVLAVAGAYLGFMRQPPPPPAE
jgi:hypothetical protein